MAMGRGRAEGFGYGLVVCVLPVTGMCAFFLVITAVVCVSLGCESW